MGNVEFICENIVLHILRITSNRVAISYLELMMKQDENGAIFLLYCLRIKLKELNSLQMKDLSLSLSAIRTLISAKSSFSQEQKQIRFNEKCMTYFSEMIGSIDYIHKNNLCCYCYRKKIFNIRKEANNYS